MKHRIALLYIFFCFSGLSFAQVQQIQFFVQYPTGQPKADDLHFATATTESKGQEHIFELVKKDWPVGQLFKIKAEALQADAGFLYVFLQQPGGHVSCIFPTKKWELNQPIGRETHVPDQYNAFSINSVGEHEVGILYSQDPIENLSEIEKKLQKERGSLEAKLRKVMGYQQANQNEVRFLSQPGFEVQQLDGKMVCTIIKIQAKSRTADALYPQVHLIAVGPAFPLLQFTQKDAQDIVAFFEQQEGRSFGKVKTYELLGKVDKNMVLESLQSLRHQQKKGKISPDDLIVVYCSSFGFTQQRELHIAMSGYTPANVEGTSIPYSSFVNNLKHINCKKILLFDACVKAQTKENVSNNRQLTRNDIAPLKPVFTEQFITILSNSSGELSYEDPAWENGAFTEVLLEALSGLADRDGDSIVTFRECYDYLRQKTPLLVQKIRGKEAIQTPVMPDPTFSDAAFVKK